MIERAVDYVLHEWKMVLAVCVLLLVGGVVALGRLDIEAYPDPAPPIIEVIAQNASWSAEEMEQQITVPLETQLNGMPGLEHMRSISLFGLSDVKCYFAYDTDYKFDRQEVINRIGMASLPAGVQPQLSPESTIGEIYRYQLVGDGNYNLRDLKEIEDWVLERHFKQVPGVIDVVSFGGATKEFHIDLDPHKLIDYHLSVAQVMTAVANANSNVGANYLDIGSQSFNVRGIGLFKDTSDIEKAVVAEHNGVPIYVRQLGTVSIGRKVPLGRVGRDEVRDIVEGIVLMRPGGQSLPTLAGVKAEVQRLNKDILPKGVQVVPYLDRTHLIGVTTHTVQHTLMLGMVLVAFILVAFLGDLRAALIVALTIPLSLCFVFVIMVLRGDAANLISMGAIDFGIIVDASVVMVENIHRHLTATSPSSTRVRLLVSEGAKEVIAPIFFSTIVIFVSFLPLFTMQGVEGKIFGPMALTYGLALLGALILSFTFSPVLSSLLLKRQPEHGETLIVRLVRRPYEMLVRRAVKHPHVTLTLAGVSLLLTGLLLGQLGGEFMPKLEEGNLWVRATMPLSISYEYASDISDRVRHIFKSYPEVTTVVSQLGRPDDGSDATSYFNGEFLVNLQPREQWPAGVTKEKLISSMEKQLEDTYPGIDFNFSQAIEDNVEEAMSGVKGENSIKIIGSDLDTLEKLASGIEDVMKHVEGVKDLGVLHELGLPNLLIRVDRDAAARYGIQVGDVNAAINAAIGGASATQVLQGDRRFDVVVRLQAPYRDSPEAIGRIPLMSADGAIIPLSQVAHIEFKSGAGFIYREDNERYIPIKFSVRGRDLKSTIAEAEEKISPKVKFPEGYRRQWSGEFEELQAAVRRLSIVIPISLLIILLLLNKAFNNTREALMILATVPLASIGGLLALLVTHTHFSISAAVGFISLFGVCVMQGVLLVSRIKQLQHEGLERDQAVMVGSEMQLRPVLMVAMSAAIGLLPAAMATGIGSETQRPLATVVVGGMVTSAVVILLVLPALYRVFGTTVTRAVDAD
jgi:cobalt-zinc-cadmium resistance protein CzcA